MRIAQVSSFEMKGENVFWAPSPRSLYEPDDRCGAGAGAGPGVGGGSRYLGRNPEP